MAFNQFDEINRLLGLTAPRAASRTSMPPLTLEEQQSLSSQVLGGGLSTLGFIGGVLDTPGSWIRNTLAGENPFMGTFDFEERTSGREMLEGMGMLDENVEGLDWGDVAGFGAEVLLDPLTYLTGGAAALGKAGKVAKAVKKLPTRTSDMMDASGKLLKGKGIREQMTKTTLDDILKAEPAGAARDVLRKRMEDAVSGMKGKTTLKDILAEPLAPSPLKFNFPFVGGPRVGGAGLARTMDVTGHAIRFSPPGRVTARMFSPAVRGAKSALGQVEAALGFSRGTSREAAIRHEHAVREQAFESAGLSDDASTELFEKSAATTEGTWKLESGETWDMFSGLSNEKKVEKAFERNMDPHLQPLVGKKITQEDYDLIKKTYRDMYEQNVAHHKELIEQGIDVKLWDEAATLYHPRTIIRDRGGKGGKGGKKTFATSTPAELKRNPFFHNLAATQEHAGGRGAIEALLRDDRFLGDAAKSHKAQRKLLFKDYLGGSDGEWLQLVDMDKEIDDIIKASEAAGEKISKETAVERAIEVLYHTDSAREAGRALFARNKQLDEGFTFLSGKDLRGADELFFGRSPLKDFADRAVHNVQGVEASKAAYRLLGRAAYKGVQKGDDVLLTDAIKSATNLGKSTDANRQMLARIAENLNGQDAFKGMFPDTHPLRDLGSDITDWKAAKKSLSEGSDALYVSKGVADDLGRTMKVYLDPASGEGFSKVWDQFSNTFRALVTTPFPAFHTRNAITAMWQNYVVGAFDPTVRGGLLNPKAYIQPILDMRRFVKTGKLPKGWEKVPHFKGMTEAQATREFRALIYAHHVAPKGALYSSVSTGGVSRAGEGSVLDELMGVPGRTAIEKPGFFGWRSLARGYKESLLNPKRDINIFGVKGGFGKTADKAAELGEDVLGFVKGGREAGRYVEEVNRAATVWAKMKQGYTPEAAADISRGAHVDYRLNTEWEKKYGKRIFPFYQFTSRMVPWQLREIARRPGGPVPKVMRAAERSREEGGYVPEHLRGTLGIKAGRGAEGTSTQYLTGLDLPHEVIGDLIKVDPADPLSFNSFLETGKSVIGLSSPVFKGTGELLTGKQFYTGRDLTELEGRLSRLIEPDKDKIPPKVPIAVEQLLQNSPIARFLSSAGTLRDPRKAKWQKALNLMTGAKITDVKDTAEFYALREGLEDLLQPSPGIKKIDMLYMPEGGEATLTPRQRELFEQYRRMR